MNPTNPMNSMNSTNSIHLLNVLIQRGLLSIKNFSKNEPKVKIKRVRYNLTQKGFQEKVRLTYHFLKRKEAEYNQIKKEWEEIANNGLDKEGVFHAER